MDVVAGASTRDRLTVLGRFTGRPGSSGGRIDPHDDTVVEDVAWSYEDPLPESSLIKGYLSFDLTRASVVAELPVAS